MRAVVIALLSLALVPAAALAAPSVTITSPEDGAKISGRDFTIGTSTSEIEYVDFYLKQAGGLYEFLGRDSDPAGGFTWDVASGLPAADFVVKAVGTDGLSMTHTDENAFTIDDDVYAEFVAPTPAEGATTKAASTTVDFFTDADVVEVRCGVDPPAVYDETDLGSCEDPWVLDDLGDGQHTVAIWVKDDVGNVAFFDRTFKVDRTAPVLTVTSPAEGAVFNATAIAPGYEVVDAGGSAITVTCSLDGGAFGGCSFPAAEGAHTLVVRAEDNVANRSEVTRTFRIDKTLPALAASADVDGDDATITFTATDASALTITCSLDGHPAAPCTSGIRYSGLGTGEHAVTVRAQDAAGNARSVNVPFLVGDDGVIDVPAGGKKRKLVVRVPRRVDKSASGNRMRIRLRTPNKKRCVVTLRDADGRVVIRRPMKGFRKYRVTLLLAKVEPGNYTVRVKCKGRRAKRKPVTITA